MRSFAAKGHWKFAVMHTPKLKPPLLQNPLSESAQILICDRTWSYPQTVKIW